MKPVKTIVEPRLKKYKSMVKKYKSTLFISDLLNYFDEKFFPLSHFKTEI